MAMYDLIVIGAGSGGLNIASFMNKAGFKVLLIDKTDKSIGGDCLNWGCVPSKALIHTSHLVKAAKEAKRFGLKVSGNIDLGKVAKYVSSKKEVIRKHENAKFFRDQGMDVSLGTAKFGSRNSVIVSGEEFVGKNIILATGSRPRKLDIPGIEKVKYHTNETIFDLKKLPKHLAIIGGGPIGLEIGQAFARLGSRVTITERGDKFLPKESSDVTGVLYESLKKEGVKVLFNTSPVKFNSGSELICRKKEGTKVKITFDAVLVAIGRELNIDNLDIERAGIKRDASGRKLIVDKYLRTTNKRVFVCGDVAGSYQFTHAAEVHAGVIITNFFKPFFKKKLSYDNFSWVTFTDPQIATFGLNEKQLKERRVHYEKLVLDMDHDDRAIVDENTNGRSVLYIDGKGKILGGTMVAANAGEIFQELVLANTQGLTLKSLFNKVYAYPTQSRINKSIAGKFFSRKLTDRAKKFLRFMYRFN